MKKLYEGGQRKNKNTLGDEVSFLGRKISLLFLIYIIPDFRKEISNSSSKSDLSNGNNQFINLNSSNTLYRPALISKIHLQPSLHVFRRESINYPHYGNLGDQIIFGRIPNYYKKLS